MKKLIIVGMLLLLIIPFALANQRYVVGETFTITTCSFCPASRSAMRQMYNNPDEYPFFIPLVWQYDTEYASPGIQERTELYGVGALPHAQFGGTIRVLGGGAGIISAYRNAYNELAEIEAPLGIVLNVETDGEQELSVQADFFMSDAIDTTDNHVLFILSYDLTGTQDPNYFSSVIDYHKEEFTLTQPGESTTINRSYDLDPQLSIDRVKVIVIVQSLSEDKTIHQAAIHDFYSFEPAFSSDVQTGPPSLFVQFQDQTDSTYDLIAWEWDLTGDSFIDSYEQNPSYVYEYPGTYNVMLRVFDEAQMRILTIEDYITVTDADDVSGNVAGIWHFDYSPYRITGDIVVPEGSYLIIEPGVEVIIDDASIEVYGHIIADAEDDEPIYFTSDTNWGGLSIINGEEESLFSNVEFSKANDTALSIINSPVSLIGVNFYNNSSEANPAGMLIMDSEEISIVNCHFSNNKSQSVAAALLAKNSLVRMTNNLFVNNTGYDASAITIEDDAFVVFVNNTVANNEYLATEGAHLSVSNSNLIVYNSIIRGDEPIFMLGEEADVEVEYSNISGGFSGLEIIDLDPLFEQPSAGNGYQYDGIEAVWYLADDSPCIDAGNPSPEYYDPENHHYPGYARYPAKGTVRNDMGAFGGSGTGYWVSVDKNETVLNPSSGSRIIAYPNPFNPTINISLNQIDLSDNERVTLKIYNTKGQLIRTLVDEQRPVDGKKYQWNGTDDHNREVASGIYFVRLELDQVEQTRKILLLK